MKCIAFIICILAFSLASMAQQEKKLPDNRLFIPDKSLPEHNLFDTIPFFVLPDPDGLVFTDSIRELPFPGTWFYKPEPEFSVRYPMPVVGPGAGFSSEMPVAVPDSSVHFHILQKRIYIQRFPKVGERNK